MRAYEEVANALKGDGFSGGLHGAGAVFRGIVNVGMIPVRLRIEYANLLFCEPPHFYVENPEVIPRPVLPHLDEKFELCVVDRNAFISDPYHAAAEARGLVIRARKVIERGLTRHAVEDIAAEFPQHWGGRGLGIEFARYEGPTAPSRHERQFARICALRGGEASGWAVMTDAELSFRADQRRPNTLGELLTWAGSWDAALTTRIRKALANLSAADPHVLICAPNGMVGFTLRVSAGGPARAKALSRPNGWRNLVTRGVLDWMPIERDHGYRSDVAYALCRSGSNTPVLSGKRVLLAGCGSIGGFLARSLAQLGAGWGGGALTLVDHDRLSVGNIGRHVLGIEAVDAMKADALCALIQRDLTQEVKIYSRTKCLETQQSLVSLAELVVNATGEHGVGEVLNSWMLEARTRGEAFPTVLNVWIDGPGAAVQSYLSSDPDFGCFRCLRPDLQEPARYSPLADTRAVALIGGCGDAVFTPYGPAAPMMAAALATEHAYEWAGGHPRPLLRTVRLNLRGTNDVKPTNPPKSVRCPACGGR